MLRSGGESRRHSTIIVIRKIEKIYSLFDLGSNRNSNPKNEK